MFSYGETGPCVSFTAAGHRGASTWIAFPIILKMVKWSSEWWSNHWGSLANPAHQIPRACFLKDQRSNFSHWLKIPGPITPLSTHNGARYVKTTMEQRWERKMFPWKLFFMEIRSNSPKNFVLKIVGNKNSLRVFLYSLILVVCIRSLFVSQSPFSSFLLVFFSWWRHDLVQDPRSTFPQELFYYY